MPVFALALEMALLIVLLGLDDASILILLKNGGERWGSRKVS